MDIPPDKVWKRKHGSYPTKGCALSIKDWFKFLAIGLIWGSTFLWVKLAIREIGPFTLVMMRALFASIALFLLIRIKKMGPFPYSYIGIFLIIGLLNAALPFALVAWGIQYISSGMAAILNSTVPLFTLMIAPLIIPEERFSTLKIIGLVLGFGGVIVLVAGKVTENFSQIGIGQIAVLIAAISYALSAVLIRKKAVHLQPEWQSFLQMSAAFLFLLPLAVLTEHPMILPKQPLTWIAALWMGVMGSCVGLMLFFNLLRKIGPTRTVLTSYLFPVVAVLLGVVFLNEILDWKMIFGGIMILSGVLLVNRPTKEKL
jgi:drug/metabolite transporter (DMT)-like permease